ncbi:ribonuclease R, partial [candidate division KSB1 bacterium]|nr:ribonuclease R [candidate division KSB1 bacterium]
SKKNQKQGESAVKKIKISADEIKNFLSQNAPKTYKAKELAKNLNLSKTVYLKFRQMLKQLVNDGKIIRYQKGRFGLSQSTPEVEGELHVKTQGYGFLRRDDGGEDVYINLKNMGIALHKDRVLVKLLAISSGEMPEGVVIKVLERARNQIVGIYRRGKKIGFVVPDDIKIMKDILVPDEDTQNAQNGQKVVVEIRNWEHANKSPEGVITEILGFPTDRGVEMESVIRSFGLPHKFTEKLNEHAESIPGEIPPDELARRLDLRNDLVFTIDPEDSKDFDDAVSLKKLENGNWQLGVHIADVSYYVSPDSELDKEAQKRGTSVYLVDRVIPMLPEHLSNQICSLQPYQERLTFSVIMELSSAGRLYNSEFHQSVIKSKRRFTYEEVQAIIENQLDEPEFKATIHAMHDLSQRLTRNRMDYGSLDFDIPEPKIILDEQGVPIDIKIRERKDSHRLIEEFMLLANRMVAQYIGVTLRKKNNQTLPFVYRIHEKPDAEKIRNFIEFTNALGYEFSEARSKRPKAIQTFLAGIEKEHDRKLINQILLRSLMKAKYTTQNVGHFGLAFKYYTHFTSPIRRYPDLMVHRLLKTYLKTPQLDNLDFKLKLLEEQCKNSTDREIKAMEAERASVKLKQVEFIEKFIGETFDGIISGVVKFGIFVEIPQYFIDGLIHVNDLEPDFYVLDEKKYCLTGQNTGKIYRLGDPVQVKVARVNRDEKLIDFTLATEFRNQKQVQKKLNSKKYKKSRSK